MLNAIIIDDEPLAHEVILHHIKSHKDIKIIGQCYSATEALRKLANVSIDLLLLDINMPALSGIDMLKVLANPPPVIIISAYQDYALEGFELDVTDYLLKPVSKERLAQALEKVRVRENGFSSAAKSETETDHIVLKVERNKQKFMLDSITYFEAYGNYVKVWQSEDMTLVNGTLKQLLSVLPRKQFIQIHKSFIVPKDKVTLLGQDKVTLCSDTQLRIGKSFRLAAKKLLEEKAR